MVDKLNGIQSFELPSEKLHQLVQAANDIHLLYAKEHNNNKEEEESSNDDMVLSGDDFLPIYIYVIVQCALPYLYSTLECLSCLCDPEKRLGESGYYLASFEAAIHHILSIDVDA